MRIAKFGIGLAGSLALLFSGAVSVNAETQLQVKSDSEIAADFGLLQGDGGGLTDGYLSKPMLRYQAAILDLRLKGLETEANAHVGTDNFSDAGQVFDTSRAVLGYLRAHPDLHWQGTGDNRFEPLADVTAQQFYKVLLGDLGYNEGTDFAYADTLAFAKTKGLYRAASAETLHNSDMATMLVEGLQATVKGTSKTLAQALVEQGKVNSEALAGLSYSRLDLAWNDKLGRYFVDDAGRTLYYYTKDVADLNSCQGGCLQAWPVYDAEQLHIPASLSPSDFGRFQRSDGSMQLTYQGWPLYYYAGDKEPGDTTGEDVNHVWFVLKEPAYSVMIGTKKELGNYLTDGQGNTLYYFDKDTLNTSVCSGGCLQAWPAFYSPDPVVPTGVNKEDFTTITRADGSLQTAYKGYPLYYYVKDQQRGDTTGQDVNHVWFVVDPAAFTGTTAQKNAGSE